MSQRESQDRQNANFYNNMKKQRYSNTDYQIIAFAQLP